MSVTRDEIIRVLLRTEGADSAAALRKELVGLADQADRN